MRTWLWIAVCAYFSVWLTSCGTRTGIAAEADTDDDFGGFDGGMGRPCGYGLPCNPNDFGGRTCESLGLKAGELSCDPNTCNLVLTECGGYGASLGTGGANGSTSTGTPGGNVPGSGGAAAAGLFGAAMDGGVAFFGGLNPGMGFFGTTTTDADGGTVTTPGFFGAGFFGGGN